MTRVSFVASVVVALSLSVALGNDKAATDAIREIGTRRAELKSGVFQATEKRTLTSGETGKVEYSGNSEINCHFDNTTGRLRWIRRGKDRFDVRPAEELNAKFVEQLRNRETIAAPREQPFAAMLVRNADYMTEWYSIGDRNKGAGVRGNIILRLPAEMTIEQSRLCRFEPGSVGLTGLSDLSRPYSRCSAAEILDTYQEKLNAISSHKEGDTLYLVLENGFLRRSIEVDLANGYTVKRMTLTEARTPQEEPVIPRDESTARWELIDNIWVPVHFEISSYYQDGEVKKLECTLKWQSVNPASESFDNKQFTYRSFEGVEDDVYVYDAREGKPVFLETFEKNARRPIFVDPPLK